MSAFDGPTIGARVSHYRKMNGWSMNELATRTLNRIKSPVIANIEAGRKVDVSVEQLMIFASALQVSPTALLFDISEPASPSGVALVDESGDLHEFTVMESVWWLSGAMQFQVEDDPAPASLTFTAEVLDLFRRIDEANELYARRLADATRVSPPSDDGLAGPEAETEREWLRSELARAKDSVHASMQRLKQLGVKVD